MAPSVKLPLNAPYFFTQKVTVCLLHRLHHYKSVRLFLTLNITFVMVFVRSVSVSYHVPEDSMFSLL